MATPGETGFPRQPGRTLGQPESASVTAGRRSDLGATVREGDLAITPVDGQGRPIVVVAGHQEVVELLRELVEQNRVVIEALSALR